jgi:hypothetical protein
MSNPTTPFNWQMPTNTDLVTDLPADFEVFGQAVATSMADLLGGTTGQILSKATNTDMDFTWINNDQGDITGITATSPLTGGGTSGAITVGIQASSTTQSGAVQLTDSTSSTSTTTAATPNSVKTAFDTATTANTTANAAIAKAIVDAKGDLIAATAADTVSRLAIGTNGQVLTADSAETTGMKWSTPATASGWTKITSSTFSGQTSVSVNNCFTSTYANYRVLINFTSSATNSLYLRFRSSGSDNTANSYTGGWQYQYMANSGATSAVGGLATYIYLQDTVTGNIGHASSIDIFNPQATDRTKILNNALWTSYFLNGAGYFDNTTSFDGLTIYPTSGTITGTISIYGYGA